MPGGSGEIGGGSCNVTFQCPDAEPEVGGHAHGGKGARVRVEDAAVGSPVYVCVWFPGGESKVVKLETNKDKILFWWVPSP